MGRQSKLMLVFVLFAVYVLGEVKDMVYSKKISISTGRARALLWNLMHACTCRGLPRDMYVILLLRFNSVDLFCIFWLLARLVFVRREPRTRVVRDVRNCWSLIIGRSYHC